MDDRSLSIWWWFAKEIPAINNCRTMKRRRSRDPCPRDCITAKKFTATARFLLVANLVQWLSIDRPSIMGEDRGGGPSLVVNFYGFNVPVPLIEHSVRTPFGFWFNQEPEYIFLILKLKISRSVLRRIRNEIRYVLFDLNDQQVFNKCNYIKLWIRIVRLRVIREGGAF